MLNTQTGLKILKQIQPDYKSLLFNVYLNNLSWKQGFITDTVKCLFNNNSYFILKKLFICSLNVCAVHVDY